MPLIRTHIVWHLKIFWSRLNSHIWFKIMNYRHDKNLCLAFQWLSCCVTQPFPVSQGDGGYEHTTTTITMTFPQAQGARNAEERQ